MKSEQVEGVVEQIEVLAEWCPLFEGYSLYYPNRQQTSPAFSDFVKAVRYKA